MRSSLDGTATSGGRAESSVDAKACSRANLRNADLRDSKRGGWHHDRGTNRQSRRLREERSLREERRWQSSEDWTVDHRGGGDSRSNGAGVVMEEEGAEERS